MHVLGQGAPAAHSATAVARRRVDSQAVLSVRSCAVPSACPATAVARRRADRLSALTARLPSCRTRCVPRHRNGAQTEWPPRCHGRTLALGGNARARRQSGVAWFPPERRPSPGDLPGAMSLLPRESWRARAACVKRSCPLGCSDAGCVVVLLPPGRRPLRILARGTSPELSDVLSSCEVSLALTAGERRRRQKILA